MVNAETIKMKNKTLLVSYIYELNLSMATIYRKLQSHSRDCRRCHLNIIKVRVSSVSMSTGASILRLEDIPPK